jgi:hypothetical protein
MNVARLASIAWMASVLVAMATLAPRAAQARESFDTCTHVVTALPATLSLRGTWCLQGNFTPNLAAGNAITIDMDHITLDCNGYSIDNTQAGGGTNAIGISSTDFANITVRNCDLRGFRMGVRMLGDAGGHLVEDSRFLQNTFVAVTVHGTGSVVRRNLVLDTGASTASDFATGIYALGSVDVADNLVAGVAARVGSNGNAYGIYTESNPGGTVSGNRVRDLARAGTGSSWAVFNNNSGRMAVVDNDLVSLAPANAFGVRCQNAQGGAAGNVISGFTTALVACTSDGNNVVAP